MEKTQDECEKDPFIDDIVSDEINNRYKDPDTAEASLYCNKIHFKIYKTIKIDKSLL